MFGVGFLKVMSLELLFNSLSVLQGGPPGSSVLGCALYLSGVFYIGIEMDPDLIIHILFSTLRFRD